MSEKNDAESQSKHNFILYVKQLCLIYRNLISSLIPRIVALYRVSLEAGQVFGIFILANLGVRLFRRHFLLKQILAL
jgi:hypothetical protein